MCRINQEMSTPSLEFCLDRKKFLLRPLMGDYINQPRYRYALCALRCARTWFNSCSLLRDILLLFRSETPELCRHPREPFVCFVFNVVLCTPSSIYCLYSSYLVFPSIVSLPDKLPPSESGFYILLHVVLNIILVL